MILSYTRGWVVALFTSFLGYLIWADLLVISTEALAILIWAFSFVLWYDFFSMMLTLRQERKLAEEWNKEAEERERLMASEYLGGMPTEQKEHIVSDILMDQKIARDKELGKTEPWSGQ